MVLQVKKLCDSAVVPHYAHPGDAGLDLFASEALVLQPGQSAVVKTGIAIALPPNTEGQVRPRSGLAAKHQISVLNAPGTIDEGYRGEVGVILVNFGQVEFAVEQGMKIAQLVVKPVIRVDVESVEMLSETRRGEGGFGSTGV
ncbi:MAG: dUTP diphosphatase [Verrucomicrobia bacterium]|nr:dUTP diphosphatase [Verrucomicrobiota bacterium]